MSVRTAFFCIILLLLVPVFCQAEVILSFSRNGQNYELRVTHSINDFKDYTAYSYQADEEGKWASRKVTKYESFNDSFCTIEITGGEYVEIYEHPGYRGRHLIYQGNGRWNFPRWFWSRASSVLVNETIRRDTQPKYRQEPKRDPDHEPGNEGDHDRP